MNSDEIDDDALASLDDDAITAAPAAVKPEPRAAAGTPRRIVHINRAPVLTLCAAMPTTRDVHVSLGGTRSWAVHVALRLGHPEPTALTLGRAVAIKYALTKGEALGVISGAVGVRRVAVPPGRVYTAPIVPANPVVYMRQRAISFFNQVFTVQLQAGGTQLVTVLDGKPMQPESVRAYLRGQFGRHEVAVTAAMRDLAHVLAPEQLGGDGAYEAYMQFRPAIPPGLDGWGAAGELDLDVLAEITAAAETTAPKRKPASDAETSAAAPPKRKPPADADANADVPSSASKRTVH